MAKRGRKPKVKAEVVEKVKTGTIKMGTKVYDDTPIDKVKIAKGFAITLDNGELLHEKVYGKTTPVGTHIKD